MAENPAESACVLHISKKSQLETSLDRDTDVAVMEIKNGGQVTIMHGEKQCILRNWVVVIPKLSETVVSRLMGPAKPLHMGLGQRLHSVIQKARRVRVILTQLSKNTVRTVAGQKKAAKKSTEENMAAHKTPHNNLVIPPKTKPKNIAVPKSTPKIVEKILLRKVTEKKLRLSKVTEKKTLPPKMNVQKVPVSYNMVIPKTTLPKNLVIHKIPQKDNPYNMAVSKSLLPPKITYQLLPPKMTVQKLLPPKIAAHKTPDRKMTDRKNVSQAVSVRTPNNFCKTFTAKVTGPAVMPVESEVINDTQELRGGEIWKPDEKPHNEDDDDLDILQIHAEDDDFGLEM